MSVASTLARLEVRRWYAVPRETVFQAFTEAKILERWLCPAPDVSLKVDRLELHVGGRYRFLYCFPGNGVVPVVGEYHVIRPPEQLLFTWTWEAPDPYAGVETLVTVDFEEKDGGTEIVLTHVNFPTEQRMLQHRSGWAATLDRLDPLLKTKQNRRNERKLLMPMIDSMLMEMDQEAQTTRKLLERVPEDKLSWKPHPKSYSLGQLALHVAQIPGGVSAIGAQDVYDMGRFEQQEAKSRQELLDAFDQGLAAAKEVLSKMDDRKLMDSWSLRKNGTALMSIPRAGFFRSILLNHYYHHRGQLSVYLRLLNVPIPSIYGPSADENPFG